MNVERQKESDFSSLRFTFSLGRLEASTQPRAGRVGSAAKSGTKFSNKHPADVEQAVATHRATCVRREGISIQQDQKVVR